MKSILQNRNFQIVPSNLKVSFKNKMKIVESKTIMIVLVLVSFLFSTQHVFSQTTSNYNFNTAGELNAYFNRNNASPTVTQSTNTGIGGTGAVNLVPSVNAVFVAKQGFALGSIGSTYSCSTFFQSVGNSGYGGFGVTTNPSAAYVANASPNNGIGISVHGGGYIFNNDNTTSFGNWPTSSNWSGTDLLNGGSPDKWYQVVMTITRTATDDFDVEIKVYSANANGTLIRVAPDATLNNTFTNATMGGASTLYSYFAFGGNRIHNFDDYSTTLVGTTFTSMITTGGNLSAFNSCNGSASAEQSFSVSGIGLTDDLVITPPTGFEVSTTSGSGFASSVSLTPSSSIVNSTLMYIRLTNAASGTPSGNVVCSSTGVTSQNVAASGTVNALPTPSITGNLSFCPSGSTTLSTQSYNSYSWTNGGGNAQITPLITTGGSYQVTVTDANNCSATSPAVTVVLNPTYVAVVNNGDWNTTSTWNCNTVPPSGADVIIGATGITLTTNVTVNSLTINSGKSLSQTVNTTLTVQSGGSITNNSGTFTSNGIVDFSGSATVNGAAAFAHAFVRGAVDFGASSTLNGLLRLYVGGSVVTRPTYSNAVIGYAGAGTLNVGNEWPSGITFSNLNIDAGTTVNFGATTGTRTFGQSNSDAFNNNGTINLSDNGGNLVIQTTYVNNSGTINPGTNSTVTFSAGGASHIQHLSGSTTFHNVVFNSPGSIQTPITVNNSITLNSSTAVSNNGSWALGSITLESGVSFSGSGRINTQGEIGFIKIKNITTAKTFPIARGSWQSTYTPLTISNGQGLDYTVKLNSTNPSGGTLSNYTAARVFNGQWDISPSSAPLNPVTLSFQYNNGDLISGSNTSQKVLLHYTGGQWTEVTSNKSTPTGTNPYNVSFDYAGTFSPFSFGNAALPAIITTGTLTAFTACTGIISTEQSFSVGGSDLSANLVITPPTGYEVSTTSGSGFAASVSLVPSIGVVSSTTIYVRLTNAASGLPAGNIACTSTGATTQNVAVTGTVNATPTVSINNPSAVCSPSTIDLTSLAVTSGSTVSLTYTYWTDSSATNSYGTPTAALTNTYYIKGTDLNSCFAIASVTATVNALPTFTATKTSYNGSDLSCSGISDGKITITNVSGTSPFEYSKNNGSVYQLSNIFASLGEDPYSIKVRDSFGCISSATVVTIASVNPISASAISNTPVCAGTPLVLSGSALGGTGSYTYSWTGPNNYASDTTNSDTTTISVATLAMNGLFTLQVRDANNCAYNVSTNVLVKPSPTFSSTAAPVANTICEGTSTTITCTNGATTLNPAVFTTAYSNNFSSSIGNAWTFPAINPVNVPTIQTYNGGEVLGYLSNQQAKLNLTNLPTHDSITVDFDLYIHDTWDGNSTVSGPDMFRVILDNDTALNTTFSNETWNSTTQSYPNNFSASNASFTGSLTRTLPTACNFGGGSLSAKYHITKKVAHTASTLEMILEAAGLENVCNESWSIDNVTVQYRSQSSNSNITWTNPSVNSNSITVSPEVNTYYKATLGGCSDSIQIIVNPTPRAGFTINTVNQCVTGNSYDFTDTTTLAGGGAMTYAWTMTGAATTNATTQNVTGNIYSNHGSYNVRLVATSVVGNCSDVRGRVTKTVNVSPRVQIAQSSPNPICVGNSVRLTANQVLGGSTALVYTPTYTNNFETAVGSAWTFPAIVPANVPTIQSYNGQNVLGYLTNQKAQYNQTGLATHDYVKVEFDLYLHDSWDGNSTDSIGGSLIGKDIWKMKVNGSDIINTTFSNFSYRTQAYPGNIPAVNLNGTDAVSNTLPTLCNHSGGALSSVYRISKIIPHTSGSFNLELEALGLEELCNESWSIDNFNVELGVNTATPTLLSACNGLPVSGGPVVYTVNNSNNFQSSIGSAWSFPAISPANEPTLKGFNGDSVLGFLTNQQAVYTQSGLSSHEYVKVEFDLYLHDTWDGNDVSTGIDAWKMDVDGSNVINTTFSNFSYRTQAYPNNAPFVNANFTGAVNSSLPARCNLGGGAPSSKYRISKIVPHNASTISIVLEALGLEELCNESWSIDNFQLSLGAGSAPVSSATWNGGTTTGATSCFVDITPTTSTDYTVTIGACTSPITNIDVRPAPSPAFTITNASCSKTVSFTNNNIEANVTYEWNFGDGTTTHSGNTAPNHIYSAVGTYTVTLSASISGGCTQTTTRTIKIADAPTSGISFTGGTGCGNSVQFTNTSIIPAGNTATYLWSFGETPISYTSTAENPLHSYIADGNYSVSLIVSTGTNCSAISFVSVNALAAITGNQAIFTATVGSACGNYVTTTNSSTGTNNQYLWNFGDGNTSNEVTPTHYYTTGGFKTITLTILNGVGCATTSNKIVNISNNSGANGRVGVDFAITPTNSQVLLTNDFGFEPTFTNYPNNNPVVYCAGAPTWTYGDNTGSNSTIIYSKKYNAAGTYTVRIVQQTTNTGCFAEASKTVTVLPNPLMQLSPITFKDGETAILNNNLSTGIGSVKTENNDLAMYPNPNKGSFKVKLHSLKVADGEILVVDMLGREIYKTTFNNKSGVDLVEINNLNAAPGTYHLIISSNGNVAARKPFVIIAE